MEEKNTKQAKFWVANAMEAGDGGVVHRYWFNIELSDTEYEELYQVWFNNHSDLNNWDSDWEGHDALFDKIDDAVRYALYDLMEKNEPELGGPADTLWEISQETEDEF